MYKNLVSALYVMNIVFQCILTLVAPAAFMLLISWLFVTRLSAPAWLYAILIPLGFLAGLVSMIKFAISASLGLERLEKERNGKNGDRK